MIELYSKEYIYLAIKNKTRFDEETDAPNKIMLLLILILQSIIAVSYYVMWCIAHIPLLNTLMETLCINYARGNIGFLLRGLFYKTQLRKMGVNVFIDRGTTIIDPHFVEIGSNTFIDTNVDIYGGTSLERLVKIGNWVHIAGSCIIGGRAGVTIGDYTGIAAGSRVYSATHHYRRGDSNEFFVISPLVPAHEQCLIEAPIIIKEHVFIGFNSIVMPGVILGRGSVIGALSLVKNDVPSFAVCVGTPLKQINQRPEPNYGSKYFQEAST